MSARTPQFIFIIALLATVGCAQQRAPAAQGDAPVAVTDQVSTPTIDQNSAPAGRDRARDARVDALQEEIGAPLQIVGSPVPLDFDNDPESWVSRWCSGGREVLQEAARGLMYHVPPRDWQASTLQCYTFAIPVAGPGMPEPASIKQASITTRHAAVAARDLETLPLELVVSNTSGEELIVEMPGVDAVGAIAWYPTSLCKTPDPDKPVRKGAHTGIDTAWLQKHKSSKATGWGIEHQTWMVINGGGQDQATAEEGRYLCAGDSVRELIMSTARWLCAPPRNLVETPRKAGLTLTNLIPVPEESAAILVQFDGVQAYRIRVTLPSGVAYDSVLCFKILGEDYGSAWYSYAEFMNGVGRPITWTTLGAYDLAPCP